LPQAWHSKCKPATYHLFLATKHTEKIIYILATEVTLLRPSGYEGQAENTEKKIYFLATDFTLLRPSDYEGQAEGTEK
jgi:hypothetical protein